MVQFVVTIAFHNTLINLRDIFQQSFPQNCGSKRLGNVSERAGGVRVIPGPPPPPPRGPPRTAWITRGRSRPAPSARARYAPLPPARKRPPHAAPGPPR